MAGSLQDWALPRLVKLLPLDEDSLKQIITYTDTLPKEAAAEHLRDLLGDGPQALEFIQGFSVRRPKTPADASLLPSTQERSERSLNASPAGSGSEATRTPKRQQKKKANIHALPARRLEDAGNVAGGYRKQDDTAHVPNTQAQSRQRHKDIVADNLALTERPADATQLPLITDDAGSSSKPSQKAPPSAAGSLISDALAPKPSRGSTPSSRNASPAPGATKTKVNVSGGKAMHGESTTLGDLDAAIRALEVQTNPTLSTSPDDKSRRCNCMATRHPLLELAPNCLSCGKIICLKQGLGPCTFCGTPLLNSSEISSIVRVLKDERGEERMKANNAAHKKAEVSLGKPRAFTGREFLAQASNSASARSSPLSSMPGTPADSEDEAQSKAAAHRDRLLGFQAQNARRTQIHDEAADYDIPSSGTNMWASPQERAQQLKKQQKMLRELEWNARPEYEKRRVVASIDLKGGKVVKKMAPVEKPDFSAGEADEEDFVAPAPERGSGGGAFSHNPLLGGLVRPKARESDGSNGKAKEQQRPKKDTWRRVQMDEDDNEQWILDGGVYGGRVEGRVLGAEEHAQG